MAFSPESLDRAARAIREGKLVGMPTETVYGLACNALDPSAIERVFRAKRRPPENPLIIHVSSRESARELVTDWPEIADRLARRFWPGPLTIVLQKAAAVPQEATGGLQTVAIRVPDHPIALALIETAGVPIAAPSANRFMSLSPTRPEHITDEIAAELELILDGGLCRIGVESTVVDLGANDVRILRPGGVTRAQIQAAIGMPIGSMPPGAARMSPGMYPRHYAPKAPLYLVDEVPAGAAGLVMREPGCEDQVRMPCDPTEYATHLYEALHVLEVRGVSQIYVELPPETPEWEAVHDRLSKAASQSS